MSFHCKGIVFQIISKANRSALPPVGGWPNAKGACPENSFQSRQNDAPIPRR